MILTATTIYMKIVNEYLAKLKWLPLSQKLHHFD